MLIHASVKSKLFKRGWEKHVMKEGVRAGLHNFVGSLHLDVENSADASILFHMYDQCFGLLDKNQAGSIVVLDKDGKEVCRYGYKMKMQGGPVEVPA